MLPHGGLHTAIGQHTGVVSLLIDDYLFPYICPNMLKVHVE